MLKITDTNRTRGPTQKCSVNLFTNQYSILEVINMSWNYADMSKAAKAVGGPEKYADMLVQSGRQEMYPWLVVATLASGVVTHFAPKAVAYVKEKWVSKEDAKEAREAIINGINQYDQETSDDTSSDE